MNANEINARRYFINGKEVTANRYAAMKRLNAYIGRKQAEAFSRGDMENIATRAAWFTYEAAADAEYGIARYIEDCRRFGYLKEETATETTAPEFSELSHAAQCLDIYLYNTAEIYDRYTVPAIKQVAERARRCGSRFNWVGVAKELTYKVGYNSPASLEYLVTNAVDKARRLVRQSDGLTPTAKDIEQVAHNYAAYIVDCAKYEIETA